MRHSERILITNCDAECPGRRSSAMTQVTHLPLRVSFWRLGAYSGLRTPGEPRGHLNRFIDGAGASITSRSCATI